MDTRSINANEEPTGSNPQPPAPTAAKTFKKKKGKGAKERDAVKHRIKKNQEFHDKMQERFAEYRNTETIEELFNLHIHSTTKPDVANEITPTVTPQIVDLLVDTLYDACKMTGSSREEDKITLTTVTSLQFASKIFYATVGTEFNNSADTELASKVKASLDTAVYPLSFVLDQVGKVNHEEQNIYPYVDGFSCGTVVQSLEPNARYLPANISADMGAPPGFRALPRTDKQAELVAKGILTDQGGMTPGFAAQPNQFQWQGLFQFVSYTPTFDFSHLVDRYNRLLARINRRVNGLTVPANIQEGRGTLAQLVASTELRGGITQVWSNRTISPDALVIGGALKLGYRLQSPSKAFDFRCCELTFETAGVLTKFVNTITRKAR